MANHYIRQGASGIADGSDWTNAWTDLPVTFVRGDIYWVATGVYGLHVFDTAVSGNENVYIYKAKLSLHGTENGWDSSYGIGQAEFQSGNNICWEPRTPYWWFDGQSGSGAGGQGFKLTGQTDDGNKAIVYLVYGQNPHHVTFRHIELAGYGSGSSNQNRAFEENCGSPTISDITIQYCYFHDCGQFWIYIAQQCPNVLIELNYFKNVGSGNSNYHSVGICFGAYNGTANCTVRYNVIDSMHLTGSTGYISVQNAGTSSGYYIYGNIFVESLDGCGEETIGTDSAAIVNGMYVYNNTFYGLQGLNGNSVGVYIGNASSTNVVVQNNVWQGCAYTPMFTNVSTEDHNIKNTGEISFVNAAGGDFHLNAETSAGVTLSSPFDIDPDGIVRGSSGTWSKGAYQFGGSLSPGLKTVMVLR